VRIKTKGGKKRDEERVGEECKRASEKGRGEKI